AVQLGAEILMVYAGRAGGEMNFRKKWLGKMGDVARAGRTVVLVSHQLNQIRRLCHRVVWIDDGSVRQDGPTHEVVAAYESAMASGERNGGQSARGVDDAGRVVNWEIIAPRAQDLYTLTTVGRV